MGEYAKRNSDGQEIKIGTCESMYYLRYEDRFKVSKLNGSLDAGKELNLFWRLPFPDEDHIPPGTYPEYNRGERLWKAKPNGEYSIDFTDSSTIESPGLIQLTHPSGLLVNVNCYHGEKLPVDSADLKSGWNGKSWTYELAHIKNREDGIFPIVHCRFCGQLWRYTWEEILPYLHGEMKKRLEKYTINQEVSK